MRDTGLVSIIIPVYKSQDYLEECINSVLAQSYKNFEVIIVLDGPDDCCLSICNKLKCLDDRIFINIISHQGVSAARNFGMKKMRGQYVAFVDSDDILHPDFLKILLDEINGYEADISCCNYHRSRNKGANINPESVCVSGNEAICYCRLKDAGRPFYGTSLWNKLFRTSLLRDSDVFDESFSFGEDTMFMFRIMVRTDKVSFNKSDLYCYREKQADVRKEYETLQNFIKYYNWEREFFTNVIKEERLISETDKMLSQYKIHSIICSYNNGCSSSRKEITDNWEIAKKYIVDDKQTSIPGRIKMTTVLWMIRFRVHRRIVSLIYNIGR